jgi:hypothetical protein
MSLTPFSPSLILPKHDSAVSMLPSRGGHPPCFQAPRMPACDAGGGRALYERATLSVLVWSVLNIGKHTFAIKVA